VKSVAALQARGLTHALVEPRSVKLEIDLARGQHEAAVEAGSLVETARATGTADTMPPALASAAAALAPKSPEQACALLAELEQAAGTVETPYYARQLPAMVRTALAAGDPAQATRLVDRLKPHYSLDEHALCSARAQLTEHAGELEEAAALYAEAASRWQEFGNVPERAYALLGLGRCLRALGQTGAEEPLLEARDLFASMGYNPALAEVDELLGQPAPTTAR
jgi:tetratricopeptide (TPR) repeat protein